MKGGPNILLVEDDDSLSFLVRDYLTSVGYQVTVCADGAAAVSFFQTSSLDLCILDVMLPKLNGFDVAEAIRRINPAIPIVFLTARNQTEDRIRGFRAGADDYVGKPFSIDEFRYRIEAVLRRSGTRTESKLSLLTAGASALDMANLLVTSNGVATQLTYKEAKVLELLFRHVNSLVGREVFLKSIWEDDGFFVARSMDVFISRVRKYLKPDASLRIDNVRGVGYVLRENRNV